MRSTRSSVLALVTTALCSLAGFAQPVVSPMGEGATIRTFDSLEKYQLFDAPTGATHAGGTMHWFYNDANRPATITKANAIAQIQNAMAKWSAVCKITFSYQGETSTGFSLPISQFDGVNVVGWDATGLTAPTTGLTQIAWNGNNTIIDAEIRFNAAYSVTVSAFDATTTHEVGHALGLDHSDVSGQVMSGPPLTSYNGSTSLGPDDIAGCVKLYGAPGGGGSGPDTQAPTVPSGLTASAVSTSAINLTWNASSDNVGVANYKVFQGGTLLGTVTGTGASITSLSPGTTYSFTVAACDAALNCSSPSAPAMATTLSSDTQAPTVPTGLVASAVSTNAIGLAWNASSDNVGVANYKVFQGGTLLGTVTVTGASINSLSPGTTYSFTVSACDAAGNCSAQSAPALATTLGGVALPTANYQDMWYSPGENGWGLTITQHRDVLFLAWYVYDSTGKPTWVVMSSGTWDASHTVYSGDVYIPTGSWFGNYDGNRFAVGASAGTASITFAGNSTGTLAYNVKGVAGSKFITRLLFGPVNNAPIGNYGDMWWAGQAQNGWGLVLSQQYHNIFATWFTYDTNGQTTWYVMSGGSFTSANTYTGELYRTRGSLVIGGAYNASALVVTQVGTLTLTFSDTNTGTMTYTVDGLTQTKAITRLPF